MTWTCIDGNEAAARVAYACSETVAIYPITPASPMGEHADAWAATGRPNLWGITPRVMEMQSEAGAAGALHGAVTKGALGTTFTASQGLLLMLPNMYKIAGELTPAVIHVAARSIATHALSIFGDHSDVMAARMTGWAMLASASVQEAQDLAAISHAATLASRVPFLHFFDGFRTSHEIAGIDELPMEDLRALIDDDLVAAHRLRGLSPDRPVLRGTAQNPDVFFQAREACNTYYDEVPATVRRLMRRFAELTGRNYDLVTYHGAPDAERVIVLMGSGVGAALEAIRAMNTHGEKVGVLQVRLYRPFPAEAVVEALPQTVTKIAVLDRTKEPGATAEPLFQDVVTALVDATATGRREGLPRLIGGRYGLSSKEFTPAMVKGVFDELAHDEPRPRITVGIVDDVTHLSVSPAPDFAVHRLDGLKSAVFYGLGADGTVGANKNTVKIVGEHANRYAQGYFVYDSKKSGAMTVSHLRFADEPIHSTYLIHDADLVAIHQFGFLDRLEVLDRAADGATVLLNSPFGADTVWDRLPREFQQTVIDKHLDLWVVDGHAVAREAGLGGRINTVMQPCYFALADVLPRDVWMKALQESVETSYGKRGHEVVERNLKALDRALDGLERVEVPAVVTAGHQRPAVVPEAAPDFVQRVTATMIAGNGDLLPVSALPVDGTFPMGTTRWEKRSIALDLPTWDPSICIDCGKCAIVCPHAAIRIKAYDGDVLVDAPDGFLSKDFNSREVEGLKLTVQVAPDDCTGCGICADVCPARDREHVGHKALDMLPASERREVERPHWDFFTEIPPLDRRAVRHDDVKHSQLLEPLFEFSGACAGCGETPYLKLVTQLFGDRLIVANATGCSSIYGGNLPTTPWTVDGDGRGPAWSNSLFEDNAEFGVGIRLALEHQTAMATDLLRRLAPQVGDDLATAILTADQTNEAALHDQRARVVELRHRLRAVNGTSNTDARLLESLADTLVRQSVWIVGGDGWAYDIGFGGLDHALASGLDINILVLDTEVYSNTGGQASKATPRSAVAKFAMSGKSTPKKDLGMLATQYGNVYVGQIAMGANEMQTVKTLVEAEAWDGPSLILAYSTCIAHGIDMATSMTHQKEAVQSGYWPLYRFHPGVDEHMRPFQLDSKAPKIPLSQFTATEGRFAMLKRSDPQRAELLHELAQADVDERWRYYEQLAGIERSIPQGDSDGTEPEQEQ
jgi:pyruvate-ferredoxin/flavodoxin oxidoreductase